MNNKNRKIFLILLAIVVVVILVVKACDDGGKHHGNTLTMTYLNTEKSPSGSVWFDISHIYCTRYRALKLLSFGAVFLC